MRRLEQRQRQRYELLLVTTIVLVCVQGMVPQSAVQEVLVTALAGGSILLAFRAANLPRRAVAGALALAVGMLAVTIVRALAGGVGEGAANTTNAVLVALGPPVVALGVVRELRAAGRVRLQAVMGVLSLYLLIGLLFSFVYGALDKFAPPFFTDGVATPSECLYFSFTTLTTVGYGDLVSRSDVGHTLSVLEALIGQIYLVTVVSLVVSNLAPARRRQPYAPGTTPETEVPAPTSER